jgi:hypothetical protein
MSLVVKFCEQSERSQICGGQFVDKASAVTQTNVANLWTEFTALRCYAMVKNGNGCKILSNSWWLQLSKRQ